MAQCTITATADAGLSCGATIRYRNSEHTSGTSFCYLRLMQSGVISRTESKWILKEAVYLDAT